MPKTYTSVEDLYNDIHSNKVDKREIFKELSSDIKCKYSLYLNKLRQQKFREKNKDIVNERSRKSMSKSRKENPEKYKELNIIYNEKYKKKKEEENKKKQKVISQILDNIIDNAVSTTGKEKSPVNSNRHSQRLRKKK